MSDSRDPIVIVLAADANFCMQLAVMVASISGTTAGRAHTVYVFHDGYPPELRAKVERVAGSDVDLVWVDASSTALNQAMPDGRLPSATLFRLRVEELLPAELDRVLYLDTDMIVRHSLTPLWETDLAGSPAAAVQDSGMCWTTHLPWRELEISPRLPYFNAGVLVIPLERWRKERTSERALDLLLRFRFRDADQAALNAIFAGSWCALDPRWNVQTHHLWAGDDADVRAMEDPDALDAAIRDPAIVHFCLGMWKRPWQPESRHRYRGEWFELLDSTDWAGWRPVEPGSLFKLKRRARRAAAELMRAPAQLPAPPEGS
jgi:lipopolysaccharide biosynthesis glycosyltransferase